MKINNSCISKKRNYPGFTREVYQKYRRDELLLFLAKKIGNIEDYIAYFCTTMLPYK